MTYSHAYLSSAAIGALPHWVPRADGPRVQCILRVKDFPQQQLPELQRRLLQAAPERWIMQPLPELRRDILEGVAKGIQGVQLSSLNALGGLQAVLSPEYRAELTKRRRRQGQEWWGG